MRRGEVTAAGTVGRGRDQARPRPADGRPGAVRALRADAASRAGACSSVATDVEAESDRGVPALRGVSLEVRAGEIVGIAGVAGNGQTELAEVITGLRPCRGTIRIGGEDGEQPAARATRSERASRTSPRTAPASGSAPNLSLVDNLIMKRFQEPPIARGWLIDDRPDADAGRGLKDELRDRRAVDRHPGAAALGRQSPAADPRPRDRDGAGLHGRGPANARPRRRRDRDGPPAAARAARAGCRDPPHLARSSTRSWRWPTAST